MTTVYVSQSPAVLQVCMACGARPACSHDMRMWGTTLRAGIIPEMIDTSDWEHPDTEAWLAACQQVRPHLAILPDITTSSMVDERLALAARAEPYCDAIAIVPKVTCLDDIPPHYRIAYSVPTKHGGNILPMWCYAGRRIHLLGGNPIVQANTGQLLSAVDAPVVSLDGNLFCLSARYGWYFRWDGREWLGKQAPKGNNYLRCIAISCRSKVLFWNHYAQATPRA